MFPSERRELRRVPGRGRVGQFPLNLRCTRERLGETLPEAQVFFPYF